MTVFLTDMRHLDQVHQVRREFFPPPYPASTLVQVTSLVDPRMLIEINAVAVIPDKP
ncbi:MAG: RidA family protein [Actinomycetia bacterium]|nr:RidA family protein [Actinomycetes bacterium]